MARMQPPSPQVVPDSMQPAVARTVLAPDGEPRRRVEDARLLRGQGRFVHAMRPPGLAHAVFVRSPHARARIVAIDTGDAAAHDGVLAVLTGADLASVAMPGVNPLLAGLRLPQRPLLALERVVSVGEPVALVVARDRRSAEDAAERVFVDYESQPPGGDTYPDVPDDRAATIAFRAGDAAAGDAATAAPAGGVVARARMRQPRVAPTPLEPRAMLAAWDDATQTLSVWLGTQAPSRARGEIARALALAPAQVRLIAPDVGGAFGAKASIYPEELAVAFAAHRLRCAVRWLPGRSEEFVSASHGRGATLAGELVVDADGRFRSLQATLGFPLGSWLPFSAVVPVRNAARILPGPYRVGALDVRAEATLSNTAAVGIYRGAGRPEAAMLLERLVEDAARRLGIDPVALRRLNLVPPDAMPWSTPTGETLDSGDYPRLLDEACARFDYDGARRRQAQRRAQGALVGLGIGLYVEPCGQGWESARVTLHADGTATVASGSSPQGQGHQTAYAQIAAEALGCPFEAVRVVQGDTAACPEGIGALASRSIAIGGSAIAQAAREASARRAAGEAQPLTVETVYHASAEAWSSGCVIAQVAVDPQTGAPTIERIVWVDDAGRIVNPLLAEGQLLGGLAQGVGQAMLERVVYDDEGQLLTGSLMDYALPRATDIPPVELHGLHTPTAANALGAKGVGEAGCIGVPAAIVNAAIDALSPLGVTELDLPLTAESLWRAMNPASEVA
jgi:carbon-monoxide dehydrogenase large subunit